MPGRNVFSGNGGNKAAMRKPLLPLFTYLKIRRLYCLAAIATTKIKKLIRDVNATYFNKPVIPGKTLVFLDEIHACPNDIYSLCFSSPLEKVCGYRSTIKTPYCPFIKLKNG